MVNYDDLVQLGQKIKEIDLLFEKVKKDIGFEENHDLLPIQDFVLKLLCNGENISFYELKAKSRKREIVVVRQMYYSLLKNNTTLTFRQIGDVFKQDRVTVMFAVNRIKDLLDVNDDFVKNYEKYNEAIKNYKNNKLIKVRKRSEGITE